MNYTEATLLINDLTAKLLNVCPIFGLPPTDLESASVTVEGTTASIIFNAVDTILDGQTICQVSKVMLRRAQGRIPATIVDGELVKEFQGEELITHRTIPYLDEGLESGTTYYYRFFPCSKYGVYNFHGNTVSITVP